MINDEFKKKKMKCLFKYYNYLSCGDFKYDVNKYLNNSKL